MIILVNTNAYRGGGETLLVRFAKFLYHSRIHFKVICTAGSFIEKELSSVCEDALCVVRMRDNVFYYKTRKEKENLIRTITGNLTSCTVIRLLSFSMNDLYLAVALSKARSGVHIVHYILHPHDHRFVSKGILDRIFGFSGVSSTYTSSILQAHRSLLKELGNAGNLMVMNYNCKLTLETELNFEISESSIYPVGIELSRGKDLNLRGNGLRRGCWLGRLVDFKIPAIAAFIKIMQSDQLISLEVIGGGKVDQVYNIAKDAGVAGRVNFHGECDMEAIEAIVQNCDFGYAMGTSAYHLREFGLPVIVALGSPYFRMFASPICAGLLSQQKLGDCGDDLYTGRAGIELQHCLHNLFLNYGEEVAASAVTLSQMEAGGWFEKYVEILMNSQELRLNFILPEASHFRLLAYSLWCKLSSYS